MNYIFSWCSLPIQKICGFISKMFGSTKKIKPYQGLHQFEEEEFQRKPISNIQEKSKDFLQDKSTPLQSPNEFKKTQSPIKNEQYLIQKIQKNALLSNRDHYPEDKEQSQKIIANHLDVNSNNISIVKQSQSPILQNNPIVKLQQKIEIKKKVEVQKSNERLFIQTNSFRINLDPYQKYYALLEQKARTLSQKFNSPGVLVQIQKLQSDLRLYHSQSQKINIFFYTFKLPCTYSYYNSILNDYNLQKKLDNNIDQYKMLELITNNARINYLSYKKVLIITPRDFVYMKYSHRSLNQYWDISFSIPHQVTENKIRGDIILSASLIIQKDEQIIVHVYSQIDMKLSVSPKITKNQAINQIKKYVQRCDKFVKENYKKELA